MAWVTNRGRRKALAKMNENVPPGGANVVEVVVGTGQGTFGTKQIIVTAVALTVYIISLFFGVLFLVVLPIFYVMRVRRPPRAIGITAGGLVAMSFGFWSGKPDELVGTAELKPTESTGGAGTVLIGPLVISLNEREYTRLVAAVDRLRRQDGLVA